MHKNIEYDVIVVGAGPAGMFATLNIDKGLKVAVIEKNNSAGKKLLMAGSGRCNITHAGDIEEFFYHYGSNANFLKSALYEFTNTDLIEFLKCGGIDVIVDKNNKVFPKSERSKDVLAYLLNKCKENNIIFHYHSPVIEVNKTNDSFHIFTETSVYKSKNLILATGGKSYPNSGSTGDGYKLAKSLGHKIIEPKPALTPIYVRNNDYKDLSGISLYQKEIYLYRNCKKIKTYIGDISFTHFGLSGPGILDISRYIQAGDVVKINTLSQKEDDVRKRFIKLFSKKGNISVKKFFKYYNLPERLIEKVLSFFLVEENVKISNVDRNLRNKIISYFCELSFEVEKTGDFNIAMVTSGGVSTKEVNSKTMESRVVPFLFFAGEVLDIDGDTGGYNLQAAFSTAFLAAKKINSYQ